MQCNCVQAVGKEVLLHALSYNQYQVRETRSFHQGERLAVLLPLDHRGYKKLIKRSTLLPILPLDHTVPSEVYTL